MASSVASTGGKGGSSKKGTKIKTPKAPELTNNKFTVVGPSGTTSLGLGENGYQLDFGNQDTTAIRNALLAKSREQIDPVMAARGLPAGSEINDTALLRAALDAELGAEQVASGQRGQTMQGIQLAMAPWLQQVNRENMYYANKAANQRQADANRSANKSSKNQAMANIGMAGAGL